MNNYQIAKEKYAAIGVDTDAAIAKLKDIKISLHCWQGDDVGGYETVGSSLNGGGIQTTGNYPGKARNIAELQMDIKKAFSHQKFAQELLSKQAHQCVGINTLVSTERSLVSKPSAHQLLQKNYSLSSASP